LKKSAPDAKLLLSTAHKAKGLEFDFVVHLDSHLIPAKFATTPESTEIALFGEHEIPWKELAFRTVKTALEHYFECRRSGEFTLKRAKIE